MLKINLPKGLPKFLLKTDKIMNMVNDMADAGIDQIFNDVNNGKDFNGKQLKPLKPSTIKQKRKKGYSKPSSPLIATGRMTSIQRTKTATRANLEAHINVPEDMQTIAGYHNKGKGVPKRKFFGVGKALTARVQTIIGLRERELFSWIFKKVKK